MVCAVHGRFVSMGGLAPVETQNHADFRRNPAQRLFQLLVVFQRLFGGVPAATGPPTFSSI